MSASGLAARPSPAELGQRYRAARSPIERSHLQVVWLLSRGRGEREVAQVTGYGRRWVGEVARRYDEGGPDGLGDRGRGNAGARPLLGAEDEAALRAAPAEPSADGGLWTGPKVATWMAARLGRKVWPQRGWDYLKKLGYSAQRPRPRHAKAASSEEAAEVGERRERDPGRAVEVWAFDEHRLGLRPVLRRQWAPKGRRPVAVGHPRYEWLYLYGFVHPGTGEVVWFLCSAVDAALLSAVLAAFAGQLGAGEDELI